MNVFKQMITMILVLAMSIAFPSVWNGKYAKAEASTESILTSDEVGIKGFQIKTNNKIQYGSTEGDFTGAAFRTVCMSPDTVTANGKVYTVERRGTIYVMKGDNSSFSEDWTYLDTSQEKTATDSYGGTYYPGENSSTTYGYIATEEGMLENQDVDDLNRYYVRTLVFTQDKFKSVEAYQQCLVTPIYARAFVEAKDENDNKILIYGTQIRKMSVAALAFDIYKKSLASNYQGHQYLYDSILHILPVDSPYYQEEELTYGWNDNLYAPVEPETKYDTDFDAYEQTPDVYLGTDYLKATTGWYGDPASVDQNTKRDDKAGAISIAGKEYTHGIATNANGYFVYNVPEGAKRFVGVVGVDDVAKKDSNYIKGATITCSIYFDNGEGESFDDSATAVFTTEKLTVNMKKTINVPVPSGTKRIKIYFGDAGDGQTCDNASMGNAGWVLDNSAL